MINFNSLKARDAARLAVQSAVSVTVTFLLMKELGLPEEFIALLSAVLVIESSVGHTIGNAKVRLLATAVGSAIGLLSVWLLPWGYGTAVALALTMLIINGIAGFKPDWRYGVVAAIAIALGAESNALQTSIERLQAIGIGVAVGIAVTLLVWPDKAEKRALRHARLCIQAIRDEIEISSENLNREDNKSSAEASADFHSRLESAQAAIQGARSVETEPHRELIESLEKLHNSMIILKRISRDVSDNLNFDDSDQSQRIEDVDRQIVQLLNTLREDMTLDEDDRDELNTLVESIQSTVEFSDDQRVNTLRQTYVFALTEIKRCLNETHQRFDALTQETA